MSGVIHGNIDCVLGAGIASKEAAHRMFKKTFDFLESLTGSNITTRIAYNTGSFGSGTDDDDGANPWGRNSFACFRFNTSSVRTWEWYMLIQFTSGAGNFGDAPGNPGLLNGVAEFNSSGEGMMGISAATMLTTGGVSFSPWNGTALNDGNDVKGDPVWEVGIASDTLSVLPRSNNEGGSHATSRENMANMFSFTSTGASPRFHIISDEDSIAFFLSWADNDSYGMAYIGPYHPRTEISAANFTPLTMFVPNMASTNTLASLETFGTVNGTPIGSLFAGGIIVSGGVRLGRIARYDANWQIGTSYQPNTALVEPLHDIFSIPVISYEAPNLGHVGYITSPIYQEIYNADNNSENSDLTRVVLGENATTAAVKIYTGWNSAAGTPGSGNARSGTLF